MIHRCLSLLNDASDDINLKRTGSKTFARIESGPTVIDSSRPDSLGGYVDVRLTLSRTRLVGIVRAVAYA